jgi:hypothetical protein
MGHAVTFLTRTMKFSDSFLGWFTDFPMQFQSFPLSLNANSGNFLSIRLQPLSSTPFSIHYSLPSKSFDIIHLQLMAMTFNKTQTKSSWVLQIIIYYELKKNMKIYSWANKKFHQYVMFMFTGLLWAVPHTQITPWQIYILCYVITKWNGTNLGS